VSYHPVTRNTLFSASRSRAKTRAVEARSARARRRGCARVTAARARAQAGPPDKYAECLPAGAATDCQFGLTLAHRNVWQAIARAKQGAAWVFECAPAQRAPSKMQAHRRVQGALVRRTLGAERDVGGATARSRSRISPARPCLLPPAPGVRQVAALPAAGVCAEHACVGAG
jgi:hypothetical protein